MKMSILQLCVILMILMACRSSQKAQQAHDAVEDALFNKWIHHSKSQLVQQWGPPDSTTTDGRGGQILLYKERVDYKSVMNSNYTGKLYSFRKEMFINSDSLIYSWRAKRRK